VRARMFGTATPSMVASSMNSLAHCRCLPGFLPKNGGASTDEQSTLSTGRKSAAPLGRSHLKSTPVLKMRNQTESLTPLGLQWFALGSVAGGWPGWPG
jgi:hypothetical protein